MSVCFFPGFSVAFLHSIHCRSLESLLLSRPLAKLPALWQHPARAILNSCPYDLTVAGPPPAPLPSRSSSVGQAILRYVDSQASGPRHARFPKPEPSRSAVLLILLR